MKTINILFIGDLIGEVGLAMVQKHVATLCKKYKINVVLANGENAAKNGRGITPQIADAMKAAGVHIITSGNHIWAHSPINAYLEQNHDLLRPANYPAGCPGVGVTTVAIDGHIVGVINLQGRVFFKEITDCPLRMAQSVLSYLHAQTKIIIVDFHAEATAEKLALAYLLDGSVSAVLGSHTHIQTADEHVLPKGTAYISDVGMVGAYNSMIGFKIDSALRGLLTQMPVRFEVEYGGPFVLWAVVVEINPEDGKAVSIERVCVIDKDLVLEKRS